MENIDSQDGITINNKIFDDIQRKLEDILAAEMFSSFFKSKFYVDFREKTAIQNIPMTTTNIKGNHHNKQSNV